MQFLTEKSDIDLHGDETNRNTASYGELGSCVTVRFNKNIGVTKGYQAVIFSNVNCVRPCAYFRRHRLHRKPP